jgi:hypothetical protein
VKLLMAASQSTLEDSVRDLNDTNTAIYAFGFSSAKAAVSHEATKPKRPGGSAYHGDVYAAVGAFAGLRPAHFLSSLTGLVSGLRCGSQDCVLGYSLSSLTGLVSGLRCGSQDCVLGYSLSSLTGLGFWVEMRFPGLRRAHFLSSLTGLGSGLRCGSQDCVLGYSLSSLTGLVSGLRCGSQDLRPGLLSVVPDGTWLSLFERPRTCVLGFPVVPGQDLARLV